MLLNKGVDSCVGYINPFLAVKFPPLVDFRLQKTKLVVFQIQQKFAVLMNHISTDNDSETLPTQFQFADPDWKELGSNNGLPAAKVTSQEDIAGLFLDKLLDKFFLILIKR